MGAEPKLAHRLRIGWLVGSDFGPIAPDVAATVTAAAKAFADLGFQVEPIRMPALEENNGLDLYTRLHILETKRVIARVIEGRPDEIFKYAARILATPDPSPADYIAAS